MRATYHISRLLRSDVNVETRNDSTLHKGCARYAREQNTFHSLSECITPYQHRHCESALAGEAIGLEAYNR